MLPESVTETHLKYVRDVFAKRKKGESVNLFSNLLVGSVEKIEVSLVLLFLRQTLESRSTLNWIIITV